MFLFYSNTVKPNPLPKTNNLIKLNYKIIKKLGFLKIQYILLHI